jgi:NADPH:quinone reductase-like Zn-dependent oxidoreductase
MSTMRVVEITRPGGPEVLEIRERQRPDPGPHEVLIRVCAAGLNRSDLLQRAGRYPVPADASDLPGLEVAGVVERVGDGVMAWRPGDAVCALCNGGGYAEYVAAPAGQCLPVPQGLDWVAAAALPEAAFTVWFNVFQRAGLARGESLLVHGGSSGIGILAIQMAKSLGATVYATAGTADKVAAC